MRYLLILALALVASGQTIIFGGGNTAARVGPRGDDLPATCSIGQLFVKTGATAPGVYGCGTTNTWTIMQGGEGSYTLPTAAADTLGGVKVGANLTITEGVLAANVASKLADPDTATATTTIEFVPGTNITITKSCAAGKCAFTYNNSQAAYTLPTAAAGTLGGIKIGTGLSIDGNGVVTAVGGSSTSYLSWLAATCSMGAPAAGFNLPTTNYPTPLCATGTNTNYGVLSFANNAAGSAQSIQVSVALAGTVTSIDVVGKWRTAATSGDVAWQIQTACVADAETGDPSFNAAQEIADTAKGTTLQHNTFSLTGLTLTGCATGETLYLKFYRDADDAQDTLAATAELIHLGLTINR